MESSIPIDSQKFLKIVAIIHKILFTILFLSVAFVFPLAFAQAVPVTLNYTTDDNIFPNPERGFHSFSEIFPGDTLDSNAGSQGNTLVHLSVRLDSFRTGPISTEMLNTIKNAFNSAKQQNVKLIIRFLYNDGPYPDCNPDASEEQIGNHLQQLNPVLSEGEDVIAAFDAGFIGCWGEWHTSTNNLLNVETKTRIFKKILAAFPPAKQVQLRTPKHIKDVTGNLSSSEIARIGHNNDCFLASTDDDGTYTDPLTEKPYLAVLGENAVIGGETCAVSSRSSCSTAMAEMQQMHYSHINEDYHPDVIREWKTGECFQEMKKRLGYRFSLISASFPKSIKPGETFNINASIKNTGFASPYNKRPLFLVLHNGNNSYTLPLKSDPKNWKSNRTIQINESATLSTTAVPGTYKIALWLPDSAESLRNKPAYSIRLANQNSWDQKSGYNMLATDVIVDTAPLSKPGDANSDSKVDGVDYVIWLNNYNKNSNGNSSGDFDENGFVDGVDYVIWLNNYGK